jgi:hypothetical protein
MAPSPFRSPPPARREALLSRLSAAGEATLALEAQLAAHPDADPAGVLVPAARALLGVLGRSGGGELVVSLGSHEQWAVRVRQDASGPTAELVSGTGASGSGVSTPPSPTGTASAPDPAVAARLAEVLRSGGARW